MKIAPIIKKLRADCASFGGRIGGTADAVAAEKATNLKLPCAFVVAPSDHAEEPVVRVKYLQRVPLAFEVVIYVSSALDERGLDAYDQADDLKMEILASLAGHQPDDCSEPVSFSGAEVSELNAAYLAYRLSFDCAYEISDERSGHGAEIDALPPFLAIHTNFVGVDGNPESPGTVGATWKFEEK